MKTKLLTPKELMISRYEAFVKEDWAYLARTAIHQTQEELGSTMPIVWLKLEVLDSYDDIVEFKAYYKESGAIHLLHEKSRFVCVKDKWKYLDGELYNSKILRNEVCPCGSGKKFKRCCG